MATFYLDYEGGNDANDGTTFANRWKTFNSGATAARIAPGDTIRVMGSPAPTSLGISATWTNKSATVTLSSALNVLITNCDSAWTASANVTATADTSVYRTSTGSSKLAIASGFTTGLAAYFALGGAQNYSAYQGITLWVRVSAALAASTLSIRLCSDAAGVTTVDTLAIPALQAGQWVPVHINKGSALGSSIQSIALYADLDPGTIDVYLDNISTTKATGNDCLTLETLLGKNQTNDGWWALRQINGTALTLDFCPNMTASETARGYAGTTESVTTYIRKCILTDLVSSFGTYANEVQDSGSAGNMITFSGGWDRTAMTTQTLETWFDGRSAYARGLHVNSKSYVSVQNIHLTRYDIALRIANSLDCTLDTISVGNSFWGLDISGSYRIDHTNTLVGCQNLYTIILEAAAQFLTFGTVVSLGMGTTTSNGYGIYTQSAASSEVKFASFTAKNGYDGNNGVVSYLNWKFGTVVCNDNARYGFIVDWTGAVFEIGSFTATGNSSYGLYLGKGRSTFNSVTTSGNTSGGIDGGAEENFDETHVILKSSLAETTKFNTSAWNGSFKPFGGVRFVNYNGTAGDHRSYLAGVLEVFSESSVRHTASGVAWKISPKITLTSVWNVPVPIARVAVTANQTLTVSVWLRRTNTGLTVELLCPGGQVAGITNDASVAMTAAIDTWEKVTLILGPTEDGVVDFYVRAYGGTTYSAYVDDFSAAQA